MLIDLVAELDQILSRDKVAVADVHVVQIQQIK